MADIDDSPDKFSRSSYSASQSHYDMLKSIQDLQTAQVVTEREIAEIKSRLNLNAQGVEEQLKNLEDGLIEIRDMARDAMHISIGVDGKNGLRGTIENLATQVSSLSDDFIFVKQAAESYVSVKSMLSKFFITSIGALLMQFGTIVWYVSSRQVQFEGLRKDVEKLNSVISEVSKKTSMQTDPRSSSPNGMQQSKFNFE